MRTNSLLLPISLLAAMAALPQQRTDSLVSPEVHPDRRVTFRIRAPKASEAAFTGDWMKPNTSEKMTKDAGGIWSVTVGPLEPSIYIYTFTVDGVTMADPVNPRIKLRARTSASLVEVPGDTAQIWEPRDVPHGSVDVNWQKTKTLNGETRWIWVYTPPGYEKERGRRYPVLYLFHGSNDIAGGWVLAGQANFILDNLIADKKAEPMIVVMPFGHAVPFGARGDNNKLYEEYLLQDVMPLVESKYRADARRERRAIAGLSMGGGQSLYIGFGHPEMFSAIGAFSAAVPGDFETRFAAAMSDKAKMGGLKTIWFACGKDDGLITRSDKLSEILTAKGIKHTWKPTEGNHTYTVWRKYLAEFAPLLFR